MANLDYCKFENTQDDLQRCWMLMDETSDLSNSERHARERLIRTCIKVALRHGAEIGYDVSAVDVEAV
jgi:hypothetical protein